MYGSPFIVDWAFKLTLCARWRKYFQTRRGDICIVVCRQNPLLSCYHKTLFCKPFEAFAQHFIGLTWAFVICLWGNLSYRPEFYFYTYIIRIGAILKIVQSIKMFPKILNRKTVTFITRNSTVYYKKWNSFNNGLYIVFAI